MAGVTSKKIGEYLDRYFACYREESKRLTSPMPEGAGFPHVDNHPALDKLPIVCHVAKDGVIITQESAKKGPGGFIVSPGGGTPQDVWMGQTPAAPQTHVVTLGGEKELTVMRHSITIERLLGYLTFGALGQAVKLPMPVKSEDFWKSLVIRDVMCSTNDGLRERFYQYVEIASHLNEAAWEVRSAWARAYIDVRRSIVLQISLPGPGGSMSLGGPPPLVAVYDKLTAFASAIAEFELILTTTPNAPESKLHEFFERRPIILDLYGEVESKPQFVYPAGSSPMGKTHIEPDFLVAYPNQRYRLIEIERPSKPISTIAGPPTAQTTQAAYQLAEFRDFVANHYELLRERYPGISSDCSYALIIGRETEANIRSQSDPIRYRKTLANTYGADEMFTYEDILATAKVAYAKLFGLLPSREGQPSTM